MWRAYSSQPGATAIRSASQYQCIAIGKTGPVVCRTQPSNPAHPSIVIRTPVEDKGELFVRTEADTAANCPAFLNMMQQYNELTSHLGDQIVQDKLRDASRRP